MRKEYVCLLLTLVLFVQFLCVVFVGAAATSESTSVKEFIPVQQNGKWGYMDKNGHMILDCRYDYASAMMDGLAVVGYVSEKEPTPDIWNPDRSIPYYDVYLIDVTGKEIRLPVVEGQNYGDHYTETSDGNRFAAIPTTDIYVTIGNGVVQVDRGYNLCSLLYRYDGTPIYLDAEQIEKAATQSCCKEPADTLQLSHIYDISADGTICAWLRKDITSAPVCVHFSTDGKLIEAFLVHTSLRTDEALETTADAYGFLYVYAPVNGYRIVQCEKYGVMDLEGNWVVHPIYSATLMQEDGSRVLVDANGQTYSIPEAVRIAQKSVRASKPLLTYSRRFALPLHFPSCIFCGFMV